MEGSGFASSNFWGPSSPIIWEEKRVPAWLCLAPPEVEWVPESSGPNDPGTKGFWLEHQKASSPSLLPISQLGPLTIHACHPPLPLPHALLNKDRDRS